MPARIEVAVEVAPAFKPPALPMLPFLKAGMEVSVELVRKAGEANIRPSGKPPEMNKPGYGPLGGSLTTHVFTAPTSKNVGGFVRTPVYYARFLEYGTKGHPIAATGTSRRQAGWKKRLAFAIGGTAVYRRAVQHPGFHATHWMKRAADGERSAIAREFENQTERWTLAQQSGAR